ncbi:hypothetical protein ACRCQ0_00915, partial [Pseudomonas aeruginosa]
MTRVDFYVIPSADPSARLQVAGAPGGAGGGAGGGGVRRWEARPGPGALGGRAGGGGGGAG